MRFHWRAFYDTLRHKARPFWQNENTNAQNVIDGVLQRAKAAAPEVFALDSMVKANRTRKLEETALWLAVACQPLNAAMRQAVLEEMVARLEIALREAGVGDVGVAKQVPEMAAALHGRLVRYGALLRADDTEGLKSALAEHGVQPERVNQLGML